MSGEKLSSDEVPQKFAEWLLAMGCPSEKVPTVEKITEMCRGQYYMVWRSLMEHVEAKDKIKQKRLQVFCDDVRKWQKKSPISQRDANSTMPEQLALWQTQVELKDKVADMENRVTTTHDKLKQLTDKISMKMCQRNTSQRRVEDLQRRAYLLNQVAEDLKTKKENLLETRTIADSLCSFDEDVDVKKKLEKCLWSSVRRQSPGAAQFLSHSWLIANPIGLPFVSCVDNNDNEDHISSLVKCRGDALWPHLGERRAGLVAILAADKQPISLETGVNPEAMLAQTASLHCNLALEAMKNKVHIEQTGKRLAANVNELSNVLNGEACELLVLRCERARTGARVNALRALLDEVTSREGIFASLGYEGEDSRPTNRLIAIIDKNIEKKREELKKLVANLSLTETKILDTRECLLHIFTGFHKDVPLQENERYKGHLEFPQESVTTLRQFYEERREKRRNKMELSLDLDISENCSFSPTDDNNTTFTDELKLYLKKFNLEKNRKLVLESGEKIWISETLQSAVHRLYTKWQHQDVMSPLVCPSVTLSQNLRQLIECLNRKMLMESIIGGMEGNRKLEFSLDISSKKKEEEHNRDKIKKRLNKNLLSLQKTTKTLDLGQENLAFWSENQMNKYIASNRVIDNKTYKDYEACYLDIINI